jgi:hypothetical protein
LTVYVTSLDQNLTISGTYTYTLSTPVLSESWRVVKINNTDVWDPTNDTLWYREAYLNYLWFIKEGYPATVTIDADSIYNITSLDNLDVSISYVNGTFRDIENVTSNPLLLNGTAERVTAYITLSGVLFTRRIVNPSGFPGAYIVIPETTNGLTAFTFELHDYTGYFPAGSVIEVYDTTALVVSDYTNPNGICYFTLYSGKKYRIKVVYGTYEYDFGWFYLSEADTLIELYIYNLEIELPTVWYSVFHLSIDYDNTTRVATAVMTDETGNCTSANFELHYANGTLISSYTASFVNNNATASLTLPGTLPPENYYIVASTYSPDYGTVSISQPVSVATSGGGRAGLTELPEIPDVFGISALFPGFSVVEVLGFIIITIVASMFGAVYKNIGVVVLAVLAGIMWGLGFLRADPTFLGMAIVLTIATYIAVRYNQ